MSRPLPLLLLVFAGGIHIRAQLQILIGPTLVRHEGGPVRLVGGLGEGVAAGGCVRSLLQLGVKRLDDLILLL